MDARHSTAGCEPRFLLDVEAGFAEGFSPPAGDGRYFVIRCADRIPESGGDR